MKKPKGKGSKSTSKEPLAGNWIAPSDSEVKSIKLHTMTEGQGIILRHIASSRLSSDYSDFTIICKEKVFRVHKLIICPRSKYFQSTCNAGFKETTSPLHLDEKDPKLVEKLLDYLYTGRYDPPSLQLDAETPKPDDAPNDLESVKHHPCYFHVRMYGEADYFMIEDLKKEAEKRFCNSFLDSVKTLPFAGIMEELYSTRANYDGLRKSAIQMIVKDLPFLRSICPMVFSPDLMVTSIPELKYDLFLATLDRYVGWCQ